MTQSLDVPNKSHFKMKELCSLVDLKMNDIKDWEGKFEEIAPITSSSGQKLYDHGDIEAILYLKKLLHEDGLSEKDARSRLQVLRNSPSSVHAEETVLDTTASGQNDRSLDVSSARREIVRQSLNDILELTESIKTRHHWA